MKESLAYINTNVECSYKILNYIKDYKVQYINNLPKFNIFIEVNT